MVLLFAIQFAVLPVYQIFHNHHTSDSPKHGEIVLKKYEKPCCESFKATLDADLPVYHAFNFKQTFTISNSLYLTAEFDNLLFNLSNKAPPVNIA